MAFMKRFSQLGFALLLFFALTPISVFASCPISAEALSEFVLTGDYDKAIAYIETMGQSGSCECDAPAAFCFRFGPKGSETFSAIQLTTSIGYLKTWEQSLVERCGSLPQNDEQARQTKLGCYDSAKAEYDQQSEGNPFFINQVAIKLFNKQTAVLTKLAAKLTESRQKALEDSMSYRKNLRTKELTHSICELSKKQRMMIQRQSNIARHDRRTDRTKREKSMKLEYEIKRVGEQIEKQKREMKALTGQSFFLYEKCEKKKSKKSL
jgi:hypothetical protein